MENFNLNKGGAGGQQPPAGSPADRAVKGKVKKEKPMKQPKDPNAKPGNKTTLILLGVLLLAAIGGGAFYTLNMNKQDEAPVTFTTHKVKHPPMAGKIKTGKDQAAEAVGNATATEELSMLDEEKTAEKGSRNSELKTSAELEGRTAKKKAAAEVQPAVEKAKTAAKTAPKAEKPKAAATEKKKKKPSVVIAETPSSSYESYTPKPRYKKTSTSARKAPAKKRAKAAAARYNYGSEMVPAVAWSERGAMAVPRIPGRVPPPISKPASYGLSGYADVYSWSPSGMPDTPPPLRTYPASNEFSGPGRPAAPGAGFSKMSEYHKVVVIESANRNEIDRVKHSLTRHNLIPEVMSYEAGGSVYYELSIGHYTNKTMAVNKANEIASQGFPARVVSEKVYH